MDFRRIFSLFVVFLIVSITPITANELAVPYSSAKSADTLDNTINSLVGSGVNCADDQDTSATCSSDSPETPTSRSTDLKSEAKNTYLENEPENTDLNRNELKSTVEHVTNENMPSTTPNDTNSTNKAINKTNNSSQTAKTTGSTIQTTQANSGMSQNTQTNPSTSQTIPSTSQTIPSTSQTIPSTSQTTQSTSQTNGNSNSVNTNTIETPVTSGVITTGTATNKTTVEGTDNQTTNNTSSEFNVDDTNLEKANEIAERLKNDYGIDVQVKVVTVDDLITGKGDVNDYDIVQLNIDGTLIYVIYLGYEKNSNKVYLESRGSLTRDYLPLEEFLCDYTGIKITLNDTLTSRESVLYCINEITAISPAAKKAINVLDTIGTVFKVVGAGFGAMASLSFGLGFMCQGLAPCAPSVVLKAGLQLVACVSFVVGGGDLIVAAFCEGIGFGIDYLVSKIPDWF